MRKRYDDLRGVERVLTAATVAALGAGALVGCGSSEEAPRNATQPTAATAEATSSATANPSIEASADEKTPQPERSRSTDKATEIPSFPASPTQSPEQQSAEELLPGEEKLSDEENQAFRKELDQALRNGSEINIGRGIFIIERDDAPDQKGVSLYTAISDPVVANVGKGATQPVSANEPVEYFVYNAKTERWSKFRKEKIPNYFVIDRDGNAQPGLQLQRTQFWAEKEGSDLRDVVSTGTDGLMTPTEGSYLTGVTEDIAKKSADYSSSTKRKAADAAVESTTHHRSR
jgi:lipoprotein